MKETIKELREKYGSMKSIHTAENIIKLCDYCEKLEAKHTLMESRIKKLVGKLEGKNCN